MKKILLLLPLIAPLFLASCQNQDKPIITYGTYMNEGATELTNYGDLKTKLENKETLILVVHPSDESCSCWRDFKTIVDNYVNKNFVQIYKIDQFYFYEKSDFGLTISSDSPSLAIFNKGKLYKDISYSSTSSTFHSSDALKVTLDKLITGPSIYWISHEDLQAKIKAGETIINQITRLTCPDCQYCFPNVVQKYLYQKKGFSNPLFLLDIDRYRGTDEYQNIKDAYQLSESANEIFGYESGVVPTTQIWKEGKLYDASVYFNDTISYENDIYSVSKSFYTEARLKELKYLSESSYSSLVGLVIPKEDIDIYEVEEGYYYSWKQEKAAKYHTPYLEAFLKTYLA